MLFRPLILLALLVAAVAILRPGDARAQGTSCVVAFVVDGDTFNCRDGTGVRLIGVDAPERGRFGSAARRALATLLSVDSRVRLETDAESRDSQGRLQVYVFLPDGRLANEVLVRMGYAFYRPNPANDRFAQRLRSAEDQAKENKLGVWSK